MHTYKPSVVRFPPDPVDYREGKLALGQVLGEPFLIRILLKWTSV